MAELWERQYGESRVAFQAFGIYRDLGPTRSMDVAYCQLRGFADGTHLAPGSWKQRASRWRWVERADAWDAEQDRVKREAQLAEVEQMAKRHAQLASVFLAKVVERLQSLRPDELTPAQMPNWLDVAVRIERTSRGLAAQIIEQQLTSPSGRPVAAELTEEHDDKHALAVIERLVAAGALAIASGDSSGGAAVHPADADGDPGGVPSAQ